MGPQQKTKFWMAKKGILPSEKVQITNSAEAPFMVKLDFKITNICLQILQMK